MAEYIEREAVVRAFCEHCRDYVDKCTYDGACEVDIIATVPTADVQPVKRGYWKFDGGVIQCNNCNFTLNENSFGRVVKKFFKFCPNCGADMRGEKDA